MLEMVIVIILVAILFAVAADRLLKYRIAAERVALAYSVAKLRTAVTLEMAHHIIRQEMHKLLDLVGANPMGFLLEQPESYAGVFPSPDLEKIDEGQWFFDSHQGMLVYKVRFGDHFVTDLAGIPRARFKIFLVYADKNKNGRYDRSGDSIMGVKLAPVEPYSWRQTDTSEG